MLAELATAVVDAEVVDVARLCDRDDLLLFLLTPGPGPEPRRRTLQIATDAGRARVCTTRRRFQKQHFLTGPLPDRLREQLLGARLIGFQQPAGDRRLTIRLRHDDGRRLRLEVELFGNRGLWCLTDDDGRIRELSRLPRTGGRLLRPGACYQPPPAGGGRHEAGVEGRFASPCLEAVDAHFTAHDLAADNERLRRDLHRVVERRRRKLAARLQGLAEQARQAQRAPELRQQADMLLAYGFGADPAAETLTVPHPEDADREWTIPLVPRKPIQQQADALYGRARKLEEGRVRAEQRRAAAAKELADLDALTAGLGDGDHEDLLALRERLVDRGLLPSPATKPTHQKTRLRKATRGENFRVFASAEGYTILVGRDNRQNDMLSTSIARGNDLWFHVGRGHAGSHVVVRLPKSKTASLETLLDAGTLAVHFSKARGADKCEVTYAQCKHVRKPKGLPPGRVTVAHGKTLVVAADAQRLQRLLNTLESE
ncbi:MAG: NFACT RNA binding domain-containing protein [Planctomycetota bacterium]